MIRKLLLLVAVIVISLPITSSYAQVKTNLHSTKVIEGLKGQLNGNGTFDTLKFADGTSQTTATAVDGSGTANQITYWVDSDTVGALAVATYPSLTELAHGKGVTSAIQTQLDGKSPTAGNASLTTVGTLTTGVWNATDVPVSAGGTGLSTITALSAWVANSANVITEVTPGAGNSIRINAGGTAWEAFTPADGGDMVLADIQTVTGAKTFGSAGAVGKLKIAGTTSGALTVDTSAVAGTAVITIPAVTDTLVGKATTDTLTNKTIDADGTGNSITNIENADIKAAAAIAVNKLAALTASEIVGSDGSGFLTSLAVATYPSLTELAYVKGVTSAIQTQLGLKAPLASPTFTGTVTVPTPFTIGAVSMTSTGTELNILDGATLTVTELNYVDGVTSAIQTQFGLKAPLDSPVFTTAVTLPVGLTGVIRADTGVVSVDTDITDLVSASSTTLAGKIEIATGAEVDTGTDDTRAISPLGLQSITGLPSLDTVKTTLTGVLRADTGVLAVDTDVTDLVTAATLTAAGKAELLTTAEINTGTDSTRVIPIDQYVASNRNVRYLALRVVEATTNTAVAGTKGGDFELRFAGTITGIGAYNDTAGTTGTMTVDVHLNGTTVMTTNKITIDTAEKSSLTAAVAPALTTTAVAAGGLLTIDIDAIHSAVAAKGLTVWLSIRMD